MSTRQTRARFRTRPSETRPGIVLESSSHASIDFCKRRRSTAGNDTTFRPKTPKTAKKTKTTKKKPVKSAEELAFDANELKRMNAVFEEANDFSFITEAVPVDIDYVPVVGPRPSGARQSTYANSSVYTTADDDSFFQGLSMSHDVSLNVFSPVLRSITRAQPPSAVGYTEEDVWSPISKNQRIDSRGSLLTAVENTAVAEGASRTAANSTLDQTQKSSRTSKSARFDPEDSVLTAIENTTPIKPVERQSAEIVITLDETQASEQTVKSKSLRFDPRSSTLTAIENKTRSSGENTTNETNVTVDETQASSRVTKSRSVRIDARFSTSTTKEDTTMTDETISFVDEANAPDRTAKSSRGLRRDSHQNSRGSTLTVVENLTGSMIEDKTESDGSLSFSSSAMRISTLTQSTMVGDEEEDLKSPMSKSLRLEPLSFLRTAVEDKTMSSSKKAPRETNVTVDETQASGRVTRSRSVRFDSRFFTSTTKEETTMTDEIISFVDEANAPDRTAKSSKSLRRDSHQDSRGSTLTVVEDSTGSMIEDKTLSDSSLSVSSSAMCVSTLTRLTMFGDEEEDLKSPMSKSLCFDPSSSTLTAVENKTMSSGENTPNEINVTVDETQASSRVTSSRSVRFDSRFSTSTTKEDTTMTDETISVVDEANATDRTAKSSKSLRLDLHHNSRDSILTAVENSTDALIEDRTESDGSLSFSSSAIRVSTLTQSTMVGDEEEDLKSPMSKNLRFDSRSATLPAVEDETMSPNETNITVDETQASGRVTRSRSVRFDLRCSTSTAKENTTMADKTVSIVDEENSLDRTAKSSKSVQLHHPRCSTLTAIEDRTLDDVSAIGINLHSAATIDTGNATFAIVSKKDASASVAIVSSSGETLLSGGIVTAGDASDASSADDEGDSDDEPLLINTLQQFYYLRDFNGVSANINYALHICGQQSVASWSEFSPDGFADCKKIGEGTYGEVFRTVVGGEAVALKVIPFVDDVMTYDGLVNGERMKHTLEMLPEMLITRELSSLATERPALRAGYSTPSFVRVVRMSVVKGNYAPRLLREWDKYAKKTENDRPDGYSSPEQLFVVFAMSLGGKDLESYSIKNEREALSIFFQLALSLIVAEETLEFEHRDLHWGNVLINNCAAAEPIRYLIDGKDVILRASNVRVAIIDFTNSRMQREETTIYLDLSTDEELFKGHGDYQFDIYRLMREHNRDDWMKFSPYTNVLWMDYIASKIFNAPKIAARRRKEILRTFGGLRKAERLAAFLREPPIAEIFENFLLR